MILKIILAVLSILVLRVIIKYFLRPYFLLRSYRSQGILTFYVPIVGEGYLIATQTATRGDCYYHLKEFAKSNPKLKGYALPLGSTVSISLTDPAYIRDFNNKALKYYTKDLNFYKLFNYTSNEVGLVFAEGANWKNQRKNVSEIFHFEYMTSLLPIIVKKTAEQIEKCRKESSKGDEIQFLAMKNFQTIAGDIICRMYFGNSVSNLTVEGKSFTEMMAEHLFWSSRLTFSLTNLLFGWRFFSLGLRKSDREFVHNVKLMKKIVVDLIEGEIAKIRENPTNFDSKILLHRFLEKHGEDISKTELEQLEVQFGTLFGAGMDTTGHLLAMCCYFMEKYDFQNKLREEIELNIKSEGEITYENLEKLELMGYFIKESLRMGSPSQKVFHRIAMEDNEILDLRIKKGTIVEFNLGFNFQNPTNFPEPETFNPYRWKGLTLPDPFIYAPFSAGSRNCIGQHLALLETKVILTYLLKKFILRIESGYVLRMQQGLLYEPADDIPILLKPLINNH